VQRAEAGEGVATAGLWVRSSESSPFKVMRREWVRLVPLSGDSDHSFYTPGGLAFRVRPHRVGRQHIYIYTGSGTSLRFSLTASMPPQPSFLATCLLVSSILFVPPRMLCQEPASDSAPAAASDSQTILTDSIQATGAPRPTLDTLRPVQSDTPGGPDRPAIAPDSIRPNGNADSTKGNADTTKKTDSSAAASAPRDSVLIAACTTPSGSASVARDLLVVVFTPEAGKRERAAAAKSVAGKLLGPVSSEPGAYYLRVPADGQEYRLRVAADQLIQLAQVKEVGSRACPPPSPTGKPGPSGLS
jgi:hypothetical protein